MVSLELHHDYEAEVSQYVPTSFSSGERHFLFPNDGQRFHFDRSLLVTVSPNDGAPWLGQFRMDFWPARISTVVATAIPHLICVITGGVAYMVDVNAPDRYMKVRFFPVTSCLQILDTNILVLCNETTVVAIGRKGEIWRSAPVASDDARVLRYESGTIYGTGYSAPHNADREFAISLTGELLNSDM